VEQSYKMMKNAEIRWLAKPEEHDYPAAKSYLNLTYDESNAKRLVQKLRRAPISRFKAKDIFRASSLSLLGVSNTHVEKDRNKIKTGKALSPLLLVRDKANGKVIIADGYHRLCAVYSFYEDVLIPCKIV
jgi:disulfide oxidoreductase YuzD